MAILPLNFNGNGNITLTASLACFPYSQQIEVGLYDHCAVCVAVYLRLYIPALPPIKFGMPEPICIKLDTYITAQNSISAAYFKPVSCLAYSSTLKKEMKCSSEAPLNIHHITRPYIPEDETS
jgi:hypothetical protein